MALPKTPRNEQQFDLPDSGYEVHETGLVPITLFGKTSPLAMKLVYFVIFVSAVASIATAAEKKSLPAGVPEKIQARWNEQRRFALAGLERFVVSGNFIAIGTEQDAKNLEIALLNRIFATLREGGIRALAVDDVTDNWTKTGQLICSVSYSPIDTLLELTIEVSTEMTNPRTSKTDTIVVWRHSEAENIRGPKGIPVDKINAALRLFIIDYEAANRAAR